MTITITPDISTKALIAAHNYAVGLMGGTPVNKFSDRATAEKRTRFALSQLTEDKRPQPFGPVVPGPHSSLEGYSQPEPAPALANEGPVIVPAAAPALSFGEREGTNRKRLIDALMAKRGDFVKLDDLVSAVYGKPADPKVTAQFKGPLSMVMKGLKVMIDKNALPVDLVKQKNGKDIAYGLIDKTV